MVIDLLFQKKDTSKKTSNNKKIKNILLFNYNFVNYSSPPWLLALKILPMF